MKLTRHERQETGIIFPRSVADPGADGSASAAHFQPIHFVMGLLLLKTLGQQTVANVADFARAQDKSWTLATRFESCCLSSRASIVRRLFSSCATPSQQAANSA